MLTPKFRCTQDASFVFVEIVLASICKLSEAQFDIVGHQFTFYCRPYYLRLTFSRAITEGAGERATYNLETNVLRVQLAKRDAGVDFPDLDNPNVLLATARQRVQLMKTLPGDQAEGSTAAVGAEDGDGDGEDVEAEDEFVQEVPEEEGAVGAGGALAPPERYYGFNSDFHGLFSAGRMDAGMVKEAVDCPVPDEKPERERHALCIQDENARFDEDRVFFWMEDPDQELAELCHFRASYIVAFEEALRANGVAFVTPSHAPLAQAAGASRVARPLQRDVARPYVLPEGEEEAVPLAETPAADAGGVGQPCEVLAWVGNVMLSDPNSVPAANAAGPGAAATKAPEMRLSMAPTAKDLWSPVLDVTEVPEEGAQPHEVGAPLPPQPQQQPPQPRQLAVPAVKPPLTFTFDENDTLARITPKSFIIGDERRHVDCLLVDLLLTFAYDHITTGGTGSCESSWTLQKLSRTLSWLVVHESVHEAVVAFFRRGLVFPLYPHFGLLSKCVSDVGVILLLGTRYVIRALLYMKHVFDHTEAKYVLSTLYLNPLLSHLTQQCRTEGGRARCEKWLERLASDLHAVVTGSAPASVPHRAGLAGLVTVSAKAAAAAALPAPSLSTLDLPFSPGCFGDEV